jgi:hypothetical protein
VIASRYLHGLESNLSRIEHEQVLVGRRWPKEGIQIDNDLGRQRGGASRMKDSQPSVIAQDQGVL